VFALPNSFVITLQLKEKGPPHCRNVITWYYKSTQ